MARNLLAFIALAVALWGCASPPRKELQAARLAVGRAHAAGAPELASTEYQSASEALSDGEALVRQGSYRLAREILPFAEAYAREAILKAEEEQAIRELQKIREQQQIEEAAQEESNRPPTAPTKKAISPPPPRPAKSKPAGEPPPPLTHYVVSGGETLWTIAARKDVYVDALLWPLIYKANRDQIKDPRQIYPGQVLTIPRDVSRADLEEAREKARQSDIFPVDLLMKGTTESGR